MWLLGIPLLVISLSLNFAFGQAPSSDLRAAKRVLALASKGRVKELKTLSSLAKDPMVRLFAAYSLYKIDPKVHGSRFTRALPNTEIGVTRFIGIYQSIPYSTQDEMNEFRYPGVDWTIGFGSIFQSHLERVHSGDSKALHRLLLLRGKGDGEYGEAIASGIAELFYNPGFVFAHWDLLEPHKDFLRSVKNWVSKNEFAAIRNGYEEKFQPSDPHRSVILNLLDNPE